MGLLRYVGARVKNSGLFAMARMRGGYSHFGQDLWVAQTFQGMRGGYFVDVGAYHPVIASNTYLLESQYGWKGICIEANPKLYKKLLTKRSCACVQACVSCDGQDADFLIDGGAYAGMVDHYPQGHRAALLNYLPRGRVLSRGAWKTQRMSTVTLESILDAQHAPSVMEYLSIDIEGAELSILQTFPFERYRFLAMTVEHNSRPVYRMQLRSLLQQHGYTLSQAGSLDDFYVHRDLLNRRG